MGHAFFIFYSINGGGHVTAFENASLAEALATQKSLPKMILTASENDF